MHYNVSVHFDYNISQYIYMPDKGWRLSNSGSAFLHFNSGNDTMPLNPLPKRPPYAVFSVLYNVCVVCVVDVCCINVSFCVVWNIPCLCCVCVVCVSLKKPELCVVLTCFILLCVEFRLFFLMCGVSWYIYFRMCNSVLYFSACVVLCSSLLRVELRVIYFLCVEFHVIIFCVRYPGYFFCV